MKLHPLAIGFSAFLLSCGTPSPGPAGPNSSAGGASPDVTANAAGGDGDKDGDGIADGEDACPEAPETRNGIDDADGCPETDLDRDGLVGSADKCPSDAEDLDGHLDDDGCPDVDGDQDGVADSIDQCKTEKENINAYEDSDGCPDTIPPPVKKFTGTIAGVQFEPNSSKFKKSSKATLLEAAKVLIEFKSARIEVQGHTDNVGSRKSNLALSQRRADAVRMFLIENGVDPYRVVAKGYGPDVPIAGNQTKSGQARNRRVEFRLFSDDSK